MSIFKPFISEESLKLVNQTLKSGYINEGRKVLKFENLLKKKLNFKNPITLNSGTSALHLGLIIGGIRPGDEIILPAQTFIASGTSILMCGAKPVFADINLYDGNINIESIKKKITKKTKAIMPVHWAGYPCDLDEIKKIAKKYNLFVIEDAAHALGAMYKNRNIGSISDFTCFSFQSIKHLTTGDGGALCCKNFSYYKKAQKIKWFGINRFNSKFSKLNVRVGDITELGYKYHMNDISASIGIGNIKIINDILKRHNHIALMYSDGLKNIKGLTQLKYHKDRKSSWWMYNFLVDDRDKFINLLLRNKIDYSCVNLRIDKNSIFKKFKSRLPSQDKFEKHQISLTINSYIKDRTVEKIIKIIRKGW